MAPSDKPMEGDNVVLRCKADKLIYSNLTWLAVTNMSELVESAQPCHSLTLRSRPMLQAVQSTLQGTNITLELTLPNASRQDEGLYACQVVNIKTATRTCILRRLTLKGPCVCIHSTLYTVIKKQFVLLKADNVHVLLQISQL